MPVNTPFPGPYARRPVLQVLWQGKPIPGALSATWTATNHFAPATWQASFALGQGGLRWWDGLEVPVFLDIQVGFDGNWTSLGIGQVDDIASMPEGGEAHISGRDLGALMIEEPTAESFENRTSSEIVALIALRHGLTPDVTATAFVPFPGATLSPSDNRRDRDAMQRRFYVRGHTLETFNAAARATNEWDLMVRMAQVEGFDLYLLGRTLHFHPLPKLTDAPYRLVWNATGAASPVSNAIKLNLDRKLMLARPVRVEVQSFHSRTGKTVKAVAQSAGSRLGGNVSGSVFLTGALKPLRYMFVRTNLTQVQAQALADTLLADITRHERSMSWNEPATPFITPRNVARLEGTGTGWDQAYYVDSVSTRLDFSGFTTSVKAKSHSTATGGGGAGTG